MHLWIPVELSFGRNLHSIFYCLCRKSNNHVMEMWVHVFIASWCTQIYFAYHCHFDIEDYSYFYIWFFSYFYMRQHIYASNAMKNIYYHLFISDDEGGEDKDCSQDNFFYFIRVLNIIVVLHISHEEHKKILNLYVKCQKFSPAFYHFYDLSYIQICRSHFHCFITLLPLYIEIIKIIENIFHQRKLLSIWIFLIIILNVWIFFWNSFAS